MGCLSFGFIVGDAIIEVVFPHFQAERRVVQRRRFRVVFAFAFYVGHEVFEAFVDLPKMAVVA